MRIIMLFVLALAAITSIVQPATSSASTPEPEPYYWGENFLERMDQRQCVVRFWTARYEAPEPSSWELYSEHAPWSARIMLMEFGTVNDAKRAFINAPDFLIAALDGSKNVIHETGPVEISFPPAAQQSSAYSASFADSASNEDGFAIDFVVMRNDSDLAIVMTDSVSSNPRNLLEPVGALTDSWNKTETLSRAFPELSAMPIGWSGGQVYGGPQGSC